MLLDRNLSGDVTDVFYLDNADFTVDAMVSHFSIPP